MDQRHSFIFSLLLAALAPVARGDAYAPPADYYSATVGLSGPALDSALHARTRDHVVRTYDQIRFDLAATDRDWNFPPSPTAPLAATNILLMYSAGWSGYSRSGVWDSGSTWNREHTWPDSRGVGQPDEGPDFSDLHHIRAANPSANSSRNNNYFDDGGTLGPVSQAPQAYRTENTWEPPDVDKGWIARACLYMATRYNGSEANTTDLVLVEAPPVSTSGNPAQMGRKSTLLRWSRLFPPTEWERRRNQIIFETYQGNRNPFIDYPEFADAIYEAAENRETRLTWRYRYFALGELGEEAVSGDLADPDGDGMPNLLEFALGANPRVAGGADPKPTLALLNDGRARFSYRRQRDRGLSAVSYDVETTEDLSQGWSVASVNETVLATEGAIELVVVDLPPGAKSTFVRLRVNRDQ